MAEFKVSLRNRFLTDIPRIIDLYRDLEKSFSGRQSMMKRKFQLIRERNAAEEKKNYSGRIKFFEEYGRLIQVERHYLEKYESELSEGIHFLQGLSDDIESSLGRKLIEKKKRKLVTLSLKFFLLVRDHLQQFHKRMDKEEDILAKIVRSPKDIVADLNKLVSDETQNDIRLAQELGIDLRHLSDVRKEIEKDLRYNKFSRDAFGLLGITGLPAFALSQMEPWLHTIGSHLQGNSDILDKVVEGNYIVYGFVTDIFLWVFYAAMIPAIVGYINLYRSGNTALELKLK
ncbi:MAG: hypothetical protein KC535_04265 [Nanoarchaeota archaeon]|nr:hypothetical protein [Nanoarchaeota archaeon]